MELTNRNAKYHAVITEGRLGKSVDIIFPSLEAAIAFNGGTEYNDGSMDYGIPSWVVSGVDNIMLFTGITRGEVVEKLEDGKWYLAHKG